MPFSHNTFIKAAATGAALASAVILVGCGSDDTRDAVSVSTSTTDTSTDLGSIVIGWGEQHSDSEITTPKPEDVTARCTARLEDPRQPRISDPRHRQRRPRSPHRRYRHHQPIPRDPPVRRLVRDRSARHRRHHRRTYRLESRTQRPRPTLHSHRLPMTSAHDTSRPVVLVAFC